MNPFVNYWHTPYRGSSLNLAVARVLVCVFAAWKVLAYPFAGIAAYPPFLIGGAQELGAWLPHFASWVGWEQGVAVVCLVACADDSKHFLVWLGLDYLCQVLCHVMVALFN